MLAIWLFERYNTPQNKSGVASLRVLRRLDQSSSASDADAFLISKAPRSKSISHTLMIGTLRPIEYNVPRSIMNKIQ